MPTRKLTRILPLFLVALWGLATLANANPQEIYHEITIPEGLSPEQTQSAIIKAAIGRRWNVVEKKVGLTVINLQHRGYDSTLTYKIEGSKIAVFSDSWATDKKGNRKKKKDPEGWIENLRKDIIVFMNRELYE